MALKKTVGMQLGSRAAIDAKSYITFAVSQLVTGLCIVRWEFTGSDIAYKLIKISFSEVSFQDIKRWIKFTQLIINNFSLWNWLSPFDRGNRVCRLNCFNPI